MISIDVRKFDLPRSVVIEKCDDESVRLIRYIKVEPPKEYVTMQRCCSFYGESTEYALSVHLPEQRKVDVLATVAHTSANCWQVVVSTKSYSDIRSYKTLNEVTETLKRVFV